ncbi:accessory factor UbiK family protein [Zavarzinia sp.]|uniref:accessory factor UbiK family protein n=1 Tax=Zavarzinia sp. TaxID=2027920 RepID=UPI003BB5F136|nr:accessory factor UbiK family protein [Zavarzinia sp.]
MQTENRFLDDIARLATGAVGALQGVRQEADGVVRQLVERFVADMKLVPRDEFEAVKAMAAKARAENEVLAERLAVLEAKLANPG